jgi:rhodanese-related sulfurtransferase
MINRIRLITSLCLCLLLQACGQATDKAYALMLKGLYKASVPTVNPKQLSQLLQHKQAPVLLDARSLAEYEVSHITGARFANYESFEPSQLKDVPKDTPVVVYCSVGARSERVGEQLLQAGFKNVHHLYGGLFAWMNQGNPVYNSHGKTDKIHAYSRSWGVWLQKGEKVYE